MRFLTPYRIAAYLLLFFVAGHTGGGMLAQKSMGPESDAVFEAMKRVHFTFNGSDSTWYGFWFGFGLTVSLFLLLSVVIAWQLDKVEPSAWPAVSVIAWAFTLCYAGVAALSFKYFFVGPGTFSVLVVLLTAFGAFRKSKAVRYSGQR